MDRLQTLRFRWMFASLALWLAPIGCGSDAPTTAETPATTPPVVVNDTHDDFAPTPMPGTPPGAYNGPPGTVDQAVRRASGELKHEAHADAADAKQAAREAEGDVKKAVGDVEDEARRKARELEADARKSAEEALDRLLPSPK